MDENLFQLGYMLVQCLIKDDNIDINQISRSNPAKIRSMGL